MVAGFDREHFLTFCSKLTIPSKEGGEDAQGGHTQLVPLIPIPTQLYFLDHFERALAKGVRFIVVLKCRQSGMTTLGLALDLYWCFRYPGLVHNFIGDVPKTTLINRRLALEFVESLQQYPEWRYEIKDNNDDVLSFSNRSAILWHVVNKRKTGGLGRSVGAAAFHGTECGGWEDEEGAASLMSSLAQTNPNRLFVMEGTAAGPGFFQDMCKSSAHGQNVTEYFIFIGWWLHPWYRLYPDKFPTHLDLFNVYWQSNPVLSREELVWHDTVKRRYNYEILPEQMAWWRWHLKQLKGGNLDLMYQEYPPIPEKAWTYGARSFFPPNRIIERETIISETRNEDKDFFKFDLRYGRDTINFEDSDIRRVNPKDSWWDLIMYEPPQPPHSMLRYVIGVDPVHGADEQENNAAIEVFLCYADCYVQVAEYTQNEVPAFQLAWMVLHLAALYGGDPLLCCELQGGGFELQNEIRRLQTGQAYGYNETLEKAFAGLQHYKWTPLDRTRPNTGQSYHFKTTHEAKEMMFQKVNHYFSRGMMVVRSERLLSQMTEVTWSKEGELVVPRPNDLVMAAGFATMAYAQVLDIDLGGTKHTRADWEKKLRQSQGQTREEFLQVMLKNWADQRTMQVRQGESEMQELRERRDDIADRVPWVTLNR